MKSQSAINDSLGTDKIGSLIRQFAWPSVFSMLITSLYHVVDQVYIGQAVGMLGNAAVGVTIPFNLLASATAFLIGIGTASNNNLNQGAGRPRVAARQVANGISLLIICAFCVAVLASIFLEQLLLAFGATAEIFPYAFTYGRIILFGMPFLIITVVGGHLIRSDGSPKYTMFCLASGALLNIGLTPLFLFVFEWGIAGAAWATVISQVTSCSIAVFYFFFRIKTIKFRKHYFRPQWIYISGILLLGSASFFNQIVLMLSQVVVNNLLRYYGALSIYGSEIPLAVMGIIVKIIMVFFAFCIGIAQGCQPIIGYNYGAGNYARVKETFVKASLFVVAISMVFFVGFQFFPRQIIGIFGGEGELFFRFSERIFRIYFMFCFVIAMQPITSTFFTSIGKPKAGILISLTRQCLLFLPLSFILPLFWGIDGILYAAPIADFTTAILAIFMVKHQFAILTRQSLQT
jgi:putative MATE family efflux protein